MHVRIEDWDDAYANGPNIPGGERWPEAWIAPARAFRASLGERARLGVAYGDHERERYDLFVPEVTPHGLVAFVHGGFWIRLDRSYWSNLANGPLAHGWAVMMPSYTLAPEARVGMIAPQVARAIQHAAKSVEGPIRLSGHSAGGQVVTRLCCEDASELLGEAAPRVDRCLSISGVHDLRPILRTELNETIGLDMAEADAESPALLRPRTEIDVTCWVGQSERAEFVRQSELLASIWRGLGARTASVVEPDRHHFDVIDGLADPASAMTTMLVGQRS